MADETDALGDPLDLGTDKEGRKIIYRHKFASPVRVLGKRDGVDGEVGSASEMTFREPCAADLSSGLPSWLMGDGENVRFEFDPSRMSTMMATLMVSEEPPPMKKALVSRMAAADWIAIANALAWSFIPARPTA